MPNVVTRGLLATALATAAAGIAGAQSTRPDSARQSSRPALTAEDLGVFLDGVVPLALKANDVAGAVVAVAKDGKLLFARGYGYSDVANKVPVDGTNTLFRVASISKLFTATAVMQQVEAGKLDLDADIAGYLDFTIPRRFPDKLTLRHLLTHTGGFEESFKMLPADSGKGVSLHDWITKMPPVQLYKPGTVTSYSNYGSDLAGYIVERVTATPYAEYVRQRILAPLGMTSSSIAEPLPADLRARLSKEYPSATDSAGEFEIIQGEPSGNLSATAPDMIKFALAHLALGTLGDTRILSEASARSMGTTQFRTHPRVPGMGLGFFEEDRLGYRIIGHGGDLSRFHSHLSLLMDEGVAFFVSVNSSGQGSSFYGVREAVHDAFLDRYFPPKTPITPVSADAVALSRRVAGSYTLSRRGETSLARIASLLVNLDVATNPDGSIQIDFVRGPSGVPVKWYPTDETLFRNAEGTQFLGFVPDSGGLPARFGFVGGHELHRLKTSDGRGLNFFLLVGSLIAFAATLLLWPVAALIRRRHGVAHVKDGISRGLRTTTRITALLSLAFIAAIGTFASLAFSDSIHRDARTDWVLTLIHILGLVAVLGTVPSLLAMIGSFRFGQSGWARFKYLSLALAGIAFGWFAIHWNLLSTSTRY